jgi:hypothetical protein
MFENPFTKVRRLESKVELLSTRIDILKSDKEYLKLRMAEYAKELKDTVKLLTHYKALAKVTFTMFSISVIFNIYLLGTL